MTSPTHPLLTSTRRQFFSQCGMGLGSVALASLMADQAKAFAIRSWPLRTPRPNAADRLAELMSEQRIEHF